MKYIVIKTFYKAYLIYRYELFFLFQRYMQKNNLLPLSLRLEGSRVRLSTYGRTFLRLRCVGTGKSRSLNRFFKYSRMILRQRIAQGSVTGLRYKSW